MNGASKSDMKRCAFGGTGSARCVQQKSEHRHSDCYQNQRQMFSVDLLADNHTIPATPQFRLLPTRVRPRCNPVPATSSICTRSSGVSPAAFLLCMDAASIPARSPSMSIRTSVPQARPCPRSDRGLGDRLQHRTSSLGPRIPNPCRLRPAPDQRNHPARSAT
jgi:hypothetical protein